jgi:hypothetical protein
MGDPREDPGYFEDEPFVEEIIIEPKTGNGKAKALRFQLRPFEAIKLSTEPNYRIKGILPRGGLVVVWGPPKCGKSFWTFDLVMHVALGWKYRGRKVQQGTVVYLALEGGAGFARRVEAWRQDHLADHHQPVPFHLLDVPVDLIADHKALIGDIGAQLIAMPAIVVIDTLNRSLNGSENKPEDMARYIRAADSIRSAFGCLVIIIHHCGVIGSRPRGHTSLTGADDAQIAVYRDKDGNITVEVEHMKDGEASAPMGSKLKPVELGFDDDGDQMSSCVIVPTEVVDKKKAKKADLPGTAKLALDQLRKLVAKKGEIPPASEHIPPDTKVCSAVEWRENFCNAYTGESDKPDTKRKAFVRATLKLQEVQLIGIWSDKAWLVGSGRTSGHDRTSEQMSGTMSGERLEPDKTDPPDIGHGTARTGQDIPPMGMSGMSDVRGSGLSGSFDQNLRSPESPKKETVTASLEEETAIVASVPLMITAAQKRELRALGYTDDQIRNLTPQEARLILADNCINLAALGELITQWKAAFGVGEVRTLNQVIEMAIEAINPKLYAALLAVAPMDDGRTISNVRLARWLRDFNEVVVNGLMLRGGGIDGGSGSPLWSLVPA